MSWSGAEERERQGGSASNGSDVISAWQKCEQWAQVALEIARILRWLIAIIESGLKDEDTICRALLYIDI